MFLRLLFLLLIAVPAQADRMRLAINNGFESPKRISISLSPTSSASYRLDADLVWRPQAGGGSQIQVETCAGGYCPCYGRLCFNIQTGGSGTGDGTSVSAASFFSFPDSPIISSSNAQANELLEAARLRGQADGIKELVNGFPKSLTPKQMSEQGAALLQKAFQDTSRWDSGSIYKPAQAPSGNVGLEAKQDQEQLYKEFQENPIKGAQSLAKLQAELPYQRPEVRDYHSKELQRLYVNGDGVLNRVPLASFDYALMSDPASVEGRRVRESLNQLIASEGAINLACASSTGADSACMSFVSQAEDLKRLYAMADRLGEMQAPQFGTVMSGLEGQSRVIGAFANGVVQGAVGTLQGLAYLVTDTDKVISGLYHAVVNYSDTIDLVKNQINQGVDVFKNGTAEQRAELLGQVTFEIGSMFFGGAAVKVLQKSVVAAELAGTAGALVGKSTQVIRASAKTAIALAEARSLVKTGKIAAATVNELKNAALRPGLRGIVETSESLQQIMRSVQSSSGLGTSLDDLARSSSFVLDKSTGAGFERFAKYADNFQSPSVLTETLDLYSKGLREGASGYHEFLAKVSATKGTAAEALYLQKAGDAAELVEIYKRVELGMAELTPSSYRKVVTRGGYETMCNGRCLHPDELMEFFDGLKGKDHRFSIGGTEGIPALYATEGTGDAVRATILKEMGANSPTGVMFVEKEVSFKKLLDLTDTNTLQSLGIKHIDELRIIGELNQYRLSQIIGNIAKDLGYDAIKAKSAITKSDNVIILRK